MNKLTTVLTLSTLTAALTSPNLVNPSLANASSLDQSIVAQATAPGQSLTPDEQNLFAAINAARQANGLPALTLDPALIEPARYEIMDQVKTGSSGEIAFLADGATQVDLYTLLADFGASTTGIRNDSFDNLNFTYDTPVYITTNQPQIDASGALAINWNGPATPRAPTNLMQDWAANDPSITRFLTSAAYTRLGVGTVRTGTTPISIRGVPYNVPFVRWTIFVGK